MAIIKNYSTWLAEATQPKPAPAAAPAATSLIPDLVNGAPFKKWSVSKVKPGAIIFPSWKLSANKAEWEVPVEAYVFYKATTPKGQLLMANLYTETLGIFLPEAHPSQKNKSPYPPTVSYDGNPEPSEATLAEIGKKYPTTSGGVAWDPKKAMSAAGSNMGLTKAMQDSTDAFYSYALMVDKDPSMTANNFLDMLESSIPGAKAMLSTQIKSGMPIANGKISDVPEAKKLVAAVQALPEYNQAPGQKPAGTPTPPGTIKTGNA